MLILNRKKGEKVIINDGEIAVKILESNYYQVKLGIDAPQDISVHREEIQQKINEQKEK